MGIVTCGIPAEIALELARLGNATAFVETGTYLGGTTRWAAQHFASVYTIERAEVLYAQQSGELSKLAGVRPLLGDSRTVLPRVVAGLGGQKAMFWLDGHWSGGHTAGADAECPILDELSALANRDGDIILIDDARLFLCAPPKPHRPSEWPTICDIVDALRAFRSRPCVQIVDDVIFAVPDRDPLKGHLIRYAQQRADLFWQTVAALQRGETPKRGC